MLLRMPTEASVDAQQKLLLIMSPIFILIFGLKLPSGVVLYWAVQTILSTLQQYWLMKQPSEKVTIITTNAKPVKNKKKKQIKSKK